MALALSAFAAQPLLASPVALNLGIHAKLNNVKMVKFQLRNDSKQDLTIKAGDQQVIVKAGQTTGFKVAMGADISTVNATPNHAAGSSLATADNTLSGNTLVIN